MTLENGKENKKEEGVIEIEDDEDMELIHSVTKKVYCVFILF